MHSSMRGIGYESLVIAALKLQKSANKGTDPSFLGTTTIMVACLVSADLMTFLESIRSTSCFKTFIAFGLAQYGVEKNEPSVIIFQLDEMFCNVDFS